MQMTANNLKFRGVGNPTILWNKIMKEVGEKRVAGPFKEIPYKYFIQSPVGLVSKDGGADCRLIFHLSHPHGDGTSVNVNTPKSLCTVKYPNFSEAIQLCLKTGCKCIIRRSDMRSAFRQLGSKKSQWYLMIMKATSPIDGRTYFFMDKCVAFGSLQSYAIFQEFSNCIAHLVKFRSHKDLLNYLDDYFFIAMLKALCDGQIEIFL